MLPIANALEMIPSNWPLLGHVLEDSSILKPTNAHPSGHHIYRGLDLKLLYNLENDSRVVFCDMYTHGSFEVFVMVNSVHLSLFLPKKGFTLPKQGLPTMIRSDCLIKFKQSGKGSLISYRQLNSSTNESEWMMAIVKAIRYNLGVLYTIEFWEFVDFVDADCVQLILKCDLWESMLPLLQLIFYLDDNDLLFLNQECHVCDYVDLC